MEPSVHYSNLNPPPSSGSPGRNAPEPMPSTSGLNGHLPNNYDGQIYYEMDDIAPHYQYVG